MRIYPPARREDPLKLYFLQAPMYHDWGCSIQGTDMLVPSPPFPSASQTDGPPPPLGGGAGPPPRGGGAPPPPGGGGGGAPPPPPPPRGGGGGGGVRPPPGGGGGAPRAPLVVCFADYGGGGDVPFRTP